MNSYKQLCTNFQSIKLIWIFNILIFGLLCRSKSGRNMVAVVRVCAFMLFDWICVGKKIPKTRYISLETLSRSTSCCSRRDTRIHPINKCKRVGYVGVLSGYRHKWQDEGKIDRKKTSCSESKQSIFNRHQFDRE